MPAQTTFRLESQMGNQRLARQMQTETSAWPVQKVGYERCRINECNVTHSQLLDPIVFEPSLIGRRANYRVVILHTVVAKILIYLFDTVSTAANNKVHCHEIAYASGTRPTAEGFWFYTAWGVPATEGADDISPPLVI
jgi:hypothetical protein